MVICMEIKRDEYLQRLIVRRHNGFIKVITGIRRSGKSYLLNTLFYNYLINESVDSDHIIKFAFDSAEDLLKIGEDPIVLDNEKDDRKVDPKKFLNWILPQINDDEMYYILLDEVQKLGAFESVLNGFLRKSNTDVFVTGSNSKFLSKDILTEFEGRGDEIFFLCPFRSIIILKAATKARLLTIIRFTVGCRRWLLWQAKNRNQPISFHKCKIYI